MEVKVWVEGIPKTVCGLKKDTTVKDVVKALAFATHKLGRFVLIERFGQMEKQLSPKDHLLNLLQQKGEYAVQYILRRTDGTTAGSPFTTESPSPAPQSALETPFQRNGMLRKSLTSHGTEMSVPKINTTTRTGVLLEKDAALIKENNFPSDLVGVLPERDGEKMRKTKDKENAHKPIPLVPIIPYGSDIPLQSEESRWLTRHARHASLDDQVRLPVHKLTHGAAILESKEEERLAAIKAKERKKQLIQTVRQQNESLGRIQMEERNFDREILLWEEKNEKLSREIDLMDASIEPLRISEKAVVQQLKDLSSLQLEDLLRSYRKAEESLKAQLSAIQSSNTECQESIKRADAKAHHVAEQIKRDRDLQDGCRQQAEILLREEREWLMREVQHLTVVQENQSRRLEDLTLNDQRMESTLLAKQLELDSLQSGLMKANFDEFLDGLPVNTSETLPVSPSDPESQQSVSAHSDSDVLLLENNLSPAAPARRATSSQRILVLKRNSSREGMWV